MMKYFFLVNNVLRNSQTIWKQSNENSFQQHLNDCCYLEISKWFIYFDSWYSTYSTFFSVLVYVFLIDIFVYSFAYLIESFCISQDKHNIQTV